MSLEMVRIDDRLIHGQVVVGWCPYLRPDRLILCDDEIASSEWECEIYRDAGGEYTTSIYSIRSGADYLKDSESHAQKIFLVVATPGVVLELLDCGVKIERVTVGGMHYQAGKRKISNYIYIDDKDLKDFRSLASRKVMIEGLDLPNCKPINLAKRLGIS